MDCPSCTFVDRKRKRQLRGRRHYIHGSLSLPRSGLRVVELGSTSQPGQIPSSPCVSIIAEPLETAKSQVEDPQSNPFSLFTEYGTRLLHRSICSHQRPWFVSTGALFRASLPPHYPKAVMTRAGNCGFPPSPSRYRSACITLTVCDNPHCRTADFEKPSVQPKEMCAGAPLDRRRLRTGTRTSVARPSPYQTSSPRRAEFLATVSRHACDTMSHRYPDPCRAARTGGGRARSLRAPRPLPAS